MQKVVTTTGCVVTYYRELPRRYGLTGSQSGAITIEPHHFCPKSKFGKEEEK